MSVSNQVQVSFVKFNKKNVVIHSYISQILRD